MQYVNDDMDELFRRAAKDYPLNTNSANWDKVKKKLMDASSEGENKPSNGKSRRHFLWLLLLLPLPWICERYTGDGDKEVAESVQPAKKSDASANKTAAITHSNTKNSSINLTEPASESATKTMSQSAGIPSNSNEIGLVNNAGSSVSYTNRQNPRSTTLRSKPLAALSEESAIQEFAENPKQQSLSITDQPVSTQTNTSVVAPIADTAVLAKTPIPVDATTAAPSAKKQQKPAKSRHFYAGVLGGLDITSIKMQEVKHVGYDVGLIVGYAFTKRWSIETGFLSSEKAYYTKGEYLPKAYLLPGTKLQEAEGDCRMWEVPLLVRYQFKEGKKGGWFAAAGASSYFMKEEDYTYTYYYMATGQEVERSRSYDSQSNHLFAAAQLSGGYNRNLSKTVGVRVEPYIKLPLRKVGYYDLPLTSFGVHVGVTKKLW